MNEEFSMSVPLDGEGFLRRECPTCEREFKWLPTQEGEEGTPLPDGGYFCPYCRIQAPEDAWFTTAQLEQAQSIVYQEVVEPEIEKLGENLADISRVSGGLIEARLETEHPDEPVELSETDDMRRVDFACHPGEPVKVQEEWNRPVFCLICGKEGKG